MILTLPPLIEAIGPGQVPMDELVTLRSCVQVMGAILIFAEQENGSADLRLALEARRGMIIEAYTSNMNEEQRFFYCGSLELPPVRS